MCVWYLIDDLLRGDALLHYASADTSTTPADFEKIQAELLSVYFSQGKQTSSLPPRPVCLSPPGWRIRFVPVSISPPPALPLRLSL